MTLQRRYNRQKLLTKLETNSLEKYIEDKVRKQAYLEQKIAQKRLILEGKESKNQKMRNCLGEDELVSKITILKKISWCRLTVLAVAISDCCAYAGQSVAFVREITN